MQLKKELWTSQIKSGKKLMTLLLQIFTLQCERDLGHSSNYTG